MRLRSIGLIVILALGLLAVPLAADGQPAGKVPRIGFLSGVSPSTAAHWRDGFRQGLRELGWVEGQDIAIEYRWAEGKPDRLPELAGELVRLKVDVIVAGGNAPVAAAHRATRTIPVVMVLVTDPVGLGFVASLARPGGNVTGLSSQAAELYGKRLQLLQEAVPNLSRVAVLWDPTFPGGRQLVREVEVVAPALRVQLQLLARNPDEFDRAFAAMIREGAGAVFVVGSPRFLEHRARIAELGAKNRLPSMCALPEYVEAGCLMSYQTSVSDL